MKILIDDVKLNLLLETKKSFIGKNVAWDSFLEKINHAISCIFEMREQVAEMAGKNYGNLKAHRK